MRTWLLSSLTLFLPAAVSGALWNKLPNQMTLFLPDIDPCSKSFFVFGMPMLALVAHFLFVGLCAITPWLRDVKTDLPRTGFLGGDPRYDAMLLRTVTSHRTWRKFAYVSHSSRYWHLHFCVWTIAIGKCVDCLRSGYLPTLVC